MSVLWKRIHNAAERTSVFDEDLSNIIRLEACAKYKASEANQFSSSGHAVMEISLVSGLEVDEQELASLVTRVDQYVTDYSIKDGRVILHFDSIPSDEFVCVMFPVMELYKVERLSPATFSVYEFHAPDKRCTIFYNPYEDQKLVQVCTGQECKCVEGECAKMQSNVDLSISANDRRDTACKNDIVYAYKVEIVGSEVEANFVKYSAIIKYIFKKGAASVKANTKVKFIIKKNCPGVELNIGDEYLIMGKEGFEIRISYNIFLYEYALDSDTWIEWWPDSTNCYASKCDQFLGIMDEFSEDILLSGC